MNKKFGNPSYMINTASLGVYLEYPIFRTLVGNLFFDLSITYSTLFKEQALFGHNWRFSFESSITVSDARLVLSWSNGSKLDYIIEDQSIIQYEGYREIKSAQMTKDRLYDYGTYYLFYEDAGKLYYKYEPLNQKKTYYMTMVFDRFHNSYSLTYNDDLCTTSIIDSVGRETTFVYNDKRLCTSVVLADGRETRIDYSKDHRIKKILNFEAIPSTYGYDLDGNIEYFTVGNKVKTTKFNYVVKTIYKQLASVEDRNGHLTTYEALSKDPVRVKVTDPNGHSTTYMSHQGKTTQVMNALNQSVDYTYNDYGVTQVKDQSNQITNYTYDVYGQVIKVDYPNGRTCSYNYDQFGNQTSETDNLGLLRSYVYDDQSKLIKMISPTGAMTTLTYDNKGLLTSIAYPSGRLLQCDYDQYQNTTRIYDDLGLILGTSYDAYGYNEVEVEYGNGYKNQLNFDQLNRLRSVKFPDGGVVSHEYDCCAGTLTKNQLASTTFYERDQMSNIVKVIDTLGHMTGYQYDSVGNMTKVIDSLGRVYTYDYNLANRLVKINLPDESSHQFEYDVKGNQTVFVDELGNKSVSVYNEFNHEIEDIDGKGQTSFYEYNLKGEITTIKYPNNHVKNFSHDINGKVTAVKFNEVTIATLQYDMMGNLIKLEDSSGTIEMDYDLRNRVTRRSYNSLDISTYVYDNDNNMTMMTYPGGEKLSYSYNYMKRITQVKAKDMTLQLEYDSIGRLIKMIRSNGVETHYSYDKNNQVINIKHSKLANAIASLSYIYDAYGNITGQTEVIPSLQGCRYSNEDYLAYQYNQENQIISDSQGHIYTYDHQGNLIQIDGDKQVSIEYNENNMPTRKESKTGTITHEYNSLSLVTSSVINGEEFHYQYDARGRLLLELSSDQQISNQYIYNDDQLIAMIDAKNEVYFYHFDHRGNTVAITNKDGDLVNAYEYSAYGRILKAVEGIRNRYTFMGAYGVKDEGDKLFLTHHRYYDASVGMFIQKDPIGLYGSSNLYSYVKGDPMNMIDPEGLIGVLLALGIGSAIVGGAYTVYKFYDTGTYLKKNVPEFIDGAKGYSDESKTVIERMIHNEKYHPNRFADPYINNRNKIKKVLNKGVKIVKKVVNNHGLPSPSDGVSEVTLDHVNNFDWDKEIDWNNIDCNAP